MQNNPHINIQAYLNPDPFDDINHLEEEWINWLPGYMKGETEDGSPSIYHEENIALFEKIEIHFANVFRKAFDRFQPLLKDYHFKSLQISIDYLNFVNRTSAVAGYSVGYSQPAKGKYIFHVNQVLFDRFIHYLGKGEEDIPYLNIWEHELLHLLDHDEIVRASALANSSLPANNLQYYALKYREEGIANFLDLLEGKIQEVCSIAEAKEKFKANYEKVSAKLKPFSKSTEEIRKEIYSGAAFYEIGPWLILDIVQQNPQHMENFEIINLESQLTSGIQFSEERKIDLLKQALQVNIEWFLESMELE